MSSIFNLESDVFTTVEGIPDILEPTNTIWRKANKCEFVDVATPRNPRRRCRGQEEAGLVQSHALPLFLSLSLFISLSRSLYHRLSHSAVELLGRSDRNFVKTETWS
ncbi:hypothetical protein J6590_010205 [Homalodisca vitripennis]|nr:hypothetical protein J6590_010205 [Homalodisca vitripennis]